MPKCSGMPRVKREEVHDLNPSPFPSIPWGSGATVERKDASPPTCHHILPQDPSACSLEIHADLLALGYKEIILSGLEEIEELAAVGGYHTTEGKG